MTREQFFEEILPITVFILGFFAIVLSLVNAFV